MGTTNIRNVLYTLALAAPLGACAHHPALPAEPESSEYTLGREDVVEIAVWKDPALTTVAPVRPDGRISVPLAGDMDADGKTPHQLATEIGQRLTPWVKEPVVSVIVREINSRKYAVVGEVAHPGVYPMRGRTSLLQAVAQAGGLTEFASRGGIVLIRHGKDGKEQRYSVDLASAVDGEERIPSLHPGDTVYVP
jgi:polysaccharide export outer membrane protein